MTAQNMNIAAEAENSLGNDQENRTSNRWSQNDVKKLIDLWHSNKSNAEIAAELGRAEAAVAVKASRINLPPKRDVRSQNVKNKTRMRNCLRCRTPFISEGPGNRICDPCKGSADWQGGGDYYATMGDF
jgi:uncharacterized protein with von Willebrand factor type A (vWA) domain